MMLEVIAGTVTPPWEKWPYCLTLNTPVPGDGLEEYAQEYLHFSTSRGEAKVPSLKALGGKFNLSGRKEFCLADLKNWTSDGSPKYTIESVNAMPVLGFYGHKVYPDGKLRASCLSNWYPANFKILNMDFNCTEQFMMAAKAILFKDDWAFERIMKETSPLAMKSLGRRVEHFDADTWVRASYTLVLNGLWAKFSQNIDMAKYLLSTDGWAIAEASPTDTTWGIGMSTSHGGVQFPVQWQGKNWLGFALMEVRDELKAVGAPYTG